MSLNVTSDEINKAYYGKRDTFYYLIVNDIQTFRDDKISEILGEESEIYYLGDGLTTNISMARFWKDKISIERYIKSKVSGEIRGNKIVHSKDQKLIFTIKELNREEFLSIIPEEYDVKDYITIRNSKIRKQEKNHQRIWKNLRSKYKAIDAYIKVDNPQAWFRCKNCGLIPLVWEFNNGRSTACGCGESEYVHHSIGAESIMSYVTRNNGSAVGYNSDELRMNWNQWVRTGQDIFKEQRAKNDKLW